MKTHLTPSLQSEIKSLRDQVTSADHAPSLAPPPSSDDHAPNLEIVQKELAAHKEMVAELRAQLTEKEAEFKVQ